MPAVTNISASSDSYINGLLGPYKWATNSLSFSFPSSGSFYGGSEYSADDEHLGGFAPLNATQQAAVREALAMYAAGAGLSFTEIGETASQHGDLRFAMSNAPSTAWAYYPNLAPAGGDFWCNRSDYNSPVMGSYAFTTFVHELGHALGLKHPAGGHRNAGRRDSMEYTVMSYHSYVGSPLTGYTNETWGFASR